MRDRITVVQLPEALAILRKMNPYAFEELLLTCCYEQGWEIKRNFRYSNDGGLDGRVTIAGKLYLIQAKRYSGYINPKHIHDFYKVTYAAPVETDVKLSSYKHSKSILLVFVSNSYYLNLNFRLHVF